MTKRRRIAIVGSGAWGINHVRVWKEIGELAVVCDSDAVRLEGVATQFDVPTTTDLEEVLASGDIEGVVVATPAVTHTAIASRAIEAGKDVLVEKPMALDPEDGRRLIDLAESKDRVLAVGHVLEYHPVVKKIRTLIDDGSLGRVRYIYSNRLNMGRIRTEENALWSFAPHDVAIMLRLMGSTPHEVTCRGGAYLSQGVADVTMTTLSFPGNVNGHIFVSWLHPFKEHRFVVVGERQMAVFDDTQPWNQKLALYSHSVDWLEGKIPVARKADATFVDVDEGEPLKLECLDFLRCIESREQPLTDGRAGLDVLRVLQTAQRSLEGHGSEAVTRPDTVNVHPTAVVDPGAVLGKGTRVWHFSHVMEGAHLGDEVVVGQNVFIGGGVRVGNGCKIQNNVSLYDGVELEDSVFCGPSAVFTNVINPRSEIERKNEFRRTIVRKGATVGANSTIVCGVTIGTYALIGAGATVTKDVPDFALVLGTPASVEGWFCVCGTRLSFAESTAECAVCSRHYVQGESGGVTLL